MKTRLLLVLGLLGLVPAALANRVTSRSIMDSCQFVYHTESDVRIYPPADLFEVFAGVPLYARVSFKNAWKKGSVRSETYLSPVNDDNYAELTVETMSISGEFLFREMTFEWGIKNQDGSFFDLSRKYHADIGRRFGQNCLTRRGSDSEFEARLVE